MSSTLAASAPPSPVARTAFRTPVTPVKAALTDPTAWLLGCAGFLARGGLVVAALEIWAIPSPAGISLLIPPTAISTSGVSPGFAAFLGSLGLGLGLLALGAAIVAAVVDTLGFRLAAGSLEGAHGMHGDDAAPLRGGSSRGSTRRAIAGLVLLEVAALLPALAAADVAAQRLLAVGREEYLVPSSLAVPFVVRVVERARPEVALLAGCLVLADLAYACGSRWWLRRALPNTGTTGAAPVAREDAERPASDAPFAREDAHPPASDAGASGSAARGGRWLHRGAALAAVWLAGWAATLAIVGAGLLAVTRVRAALDGIVLQLSAGAGLGAILVFVGAVALLVATWALALLLAGGASACRAALWTWLLARGPS